MKIKSLEKYEKEIVKENKKKKKEVIKKMTKTLTLRIQTSIEASIKYKKELDICLANLWSSSDYPRYEWSPFVDEEVLSILSEKFIKKGYNVETTFKKPDVWDIKILVKE